MAEEKTEARPATEILKQQHDQVKQMFSQLLAADGRERAELFDCLRATLAVHETAEEMVIYPRLRQAEDGDRIADARIAEEDEAKQVLADLEKLGPDGDGFGQKVTQFQQAVLNHASAEEQTVFPVLERTCSAEELRTMGEHLEMAERMAPTHPHPHGPNSALGNLVVGPFAKMVDAVRDAIHSRV